MNDDDTLRRIEETSVLINDTGGPVGSGYVVARGLVGTANHVVRDWVEGDWHTVTIGWKTAPRTALAALLCRDENADAAVLELKDCSDIEPIPIGSFPLSGTAWAGFGYPAAARVGNVAVGLPLKGAVHHARWRNHLNQPRMLLDADEAIAGQGTPLHGWSGSPVVAEGLVVGHVCEQFGDPEDRTRPAYGKVKACPIEAVTALLCDIDAVYGIPPSAPAPRAASAVALDGNLLPNLLAWCDRSAVIKQIRQWTTLHPDACAGLLCLAGHSDNREGLLLQRVADELSGNDPKIFSRFQEILDLDDFDDVSAVRYAAALKMGVERDSLIQESKHFADGVRLVLLGLSCDCDEWSSRQIAKKISLAAEWVNGLALGKRRLVFVLTMRHGEHNRSNPEAEQRVCAAIKGLAKKAGSPFKACATGELILLKSYSYGQVNSWLNKPIVKSGLGNTWSAFDDETIRAWFKDADLAHGKLERLVKEFHSNTLMMNRRNA